MKFNILNMKGKRILVSRNHSFIDDYIELLIVEISPSNTKIKVKHVSGSYDWLDTKLFNQSYKIIEVLQGRGNKCA